LRSNCAALRSFDRANFRLEPLVIRQNALQLLLLGREHCLSPAQYGIQREFE
jgi:hypothetical protein